MLWLALLLQTTYPSVDPASVVQTATAVTAADGTWAVTWPRAFTVAPQSVTPTVPSSVSPYIFQATSVSADGASGKCWQITPSTLGATVAALPSAVISPFVNAASGVPVTIVGGK